MSKISNETDLEESNVYINWLKKSIADEYLNYYKFTDFKNTQQIGEGAFGKVFCANWKDTDAIFALKSFNIYKLTFKEVVNEVTI